MRIAIASNGGKVAAHAGHCREFMIYDADGQDARLVETRPNPHAGEPFTPGASRSSQDPDRQGQGQGLGHGHHHGHGQGNCGHEGEGHGQGHGHGHDAGQEQACREGILGALKDCQAFVAQGAGWGLIDNLSRHGMRVLLSEPADANEAALAAVRGSLAEPSEREGRCCRH
jgi:predicted Fe-Mo cluster-binding NifX family protein